jgi:hypothetical protein
VTLAQPVFLPGVAAHHVTERLRQAGGREIESGKFASLESSAALAVNTFGWFIERPDRLPPLPGMTGIGTPTEVEIEYCARFPWRGGRHPWLDAVVATPSHFVGIESKRFEPFRDRKTVALSTAYDRPVWGDRMRHFERLRDSLRSGEFTFEYLDAAQLVKHAFGLVTEGRRRGLEPVLFYLYAEPKELGGKALNQAVFGRHRAEIAEFSRLVEGAEVTFAASSYRTWLGDWDRSSGDLRRHATLILERFNP